MQLLCNSYKNLQIFKNKLIWTVDLNINGVQSKLKSRLRLAIKLTNCRISNIQHLSSYWFTLCIGLCELIYGFLHMLILFCLLYRLSLFYRTHSMIFSVEKVSVFKNTSSLSLKSFLNWIEVVNFNIKTLYKWNTRLIT